jgi:hypothetical protein
MAGIPYEFQNMLKIQNKKGIGDKFHKPNDVNKLKRIVKEMKEH